MAAPLPAVPPVAAEVPQGPAARKRKAKTQLEPLADAGEARGRGNGPGGGAVQRSFNGYFARPRTCSGGGRERAGRGP